MEQAVVVYNSPAIPSFKDKDLKKATSDIIKLTGTIRTNAFEIAHIIADIDEKGAYATDGFKSVHEWTETMFGYKKTTSYNLLKIGRDYTRALTARKGFDCNLLPEDCTENFTTSQVEAILPLGRDEAEKLVDDGTLSPDMSVRDIKKVVKAFTADPEDNSERSEEVPDPDDGPDSMDDGPDSMIDDEIVVVRDDEGRWYEVPAYVLLPYLVDSPE